MGKEEMKQQIELIVMQAFTEKGIKSETVNIPRFINLILDTIHSFGFGYSDYLVKVIINNRIKYGYHRL